MLVIDGGKGVRVKPAIAVRGPPLDARRMLYPVAALFSSFVCSSDGAMPIIVFV
jgi:hypothetical protein